MFGKLIQWKEELQLGLLKKNGIEIKGSVLLTQVILLVLYILRLTSIYILMKCLFLKCSPSLRNARIARLVQIENYYCVSNYYYI